MNKIMNNKIIGYARSNHEELNTSIEEQEKIIRNYVEENGNKIIKVFVDKGKSKKTFSRKGLQAMLKYIEANSSWVKSLIVSDITMLSRNTDELRSLKDFLKSKGVKFISLAHLMSRCGGKPPKQQS